MTTYLGTTAAAIGCIGLLALGACDKAQEDRAAQSAAQAVHKTNQALLDAKDKTREGLREAGDAARRAGNAAAEKAGEVAREIKQDAGPALRAGALTAKVKTALLADPSVPGTRIDVDSVEGTVTLSGQLSSQAEVDRALAIARGIEGVKQVESRLTVSGS